MIYVNKKLDQFAAHTIVEANDLHLAETAIKTAVRCKVKDVTITEKYQGQTTRFAKIKQD